MKMKEYKIFESPQSRMLGEERLNELAQEGWRIVGVTQYQVFLEREKEDDIEKVEQICG